MKLIINADDFGLTPKVNEAIVKCLDFGIVRSTTLMVNQPGTQDALNRIHAGQVNDVGLHLNLVAGRPTLDPTKVPDLVGSDGLFLGRAELMKRSEQVDIEQVYLELRAQYEWAIGRNVPINHLDAHHFSAVFPHLREAYIQLANEIGLPSRRIDFFMEGQGELNVHNPDAFDFEFFDQGVSLATLQNLLSRYSANLGGSAVLEVMCHPGLSDDVILPTLSGYTAKRAEETAILTSTALAAWLEQNHIQTIGFNDV